MPPELYQAYLTPLFETWSDALVEASPPRGRALDIACGTGIVTRKIATSSAIDHVVGIDIAPPMVEAAAAATPANSPVEYRAASADHYAVGTYELDGRKLVINVTVHMHGKIRTIFGKKAARHDVKMKGKVDEGLFQGTAKRKMQEIYIKEVVDFVGPI